MPVLSIRAIYDAARAAGFDEHEAVTWTAIAMAESGGRTGALNTKGEHSVGLWQINLAADSGRSRYGDLNDPRNNARAAFDISHSGSDMRPWTTTHDTNKGTSHDYRSYLGRVEREIGVQGDPRGVHGYHADLPAPMRYDRSYDRIEPGRSLVPEGATGQVPDGTAAAGPADGDRDHDGLTDAFEKLAGTDPGKADTDGDGLTDGYEATVSHTDPLAADTDHDGTPDAVELAAGTDPGHLPGTAGVVGTGPLAENIRNGVTDTDRDGLSDHAESVLHTDPGKADTDGDDLPDAQELSLGTDPLRADTDGDGLTDRLEIDNHTNPLDQPVVPTGAGPATTGAPATAVQPQAAASAQPPASDSTKLDTFLRSARAQEGDPYVYGAQPKLSDDNPRSFDCSALTQWAAHQAGVKIPRTAEYQYMALKQQDRLIPVDEALKTKGALLFYFSREPTSSLPAGQAHVAISKGDGHTIEARGRAYGVGEWSAKHRFNYAGVLPGLSESAPPSSAPAETFAIDPGRSLGTAVATGLPGAGPTDGDRDHDGLTDAFEKLAGTDPGKADTDGDGLTDGYEATVSHTDPLAADTDHDGTPDAVELAAGTDPGHLPGTAGVVGTGPLAENIRNGVTDTDRDGLSDHAESVLHTDPGKADTDGDGLDDAQELSLGTDPLRADTDGDGLTDRLEIDNHGDPLNGSGLGAALGAGATPTGTTPTGTDPVLAGAAGTAEHGGVADALDHG